MLAFGHNKVMTEETKQRLQDRFKQLLDTTGENPRTLFEIEELTMRLREKLTQATLEEISRDVQEPIEEETRKRRASLESLLCPLPSECFV